MLNRIYTIWTITLLISKTTNGLSEIESCTNATTSCPLTKDAWMQRSKVFNCTQHNYACIRTSSNTLVECCIPAFDIDAGTGRCPEVNFCDNTYPLLNVEKRFRECPEEIFGCPKKDHAAFTVIELYKYPACLVKEFSDLRKPETTSSDESTEGLTKLTTTNAESTTKSNASTRKFKTSTPKLVTSLYKMVTTSFPKKDEASHFNHTNPWHVVLFLLNMIIIIALLFLCRRVPGKRFLQCSTCESDDVEKLYCCNDRAENSKIERLKGIVLTVTNRLSRSFQLSPLQKYSDLSLLELIVPPILRHDRLSCNTYIKIENKGTENEGIEEENDDNSKPEYKNFELQNPIDIFYRNCERLRRIFLVGEAGSGKTTFCHWLLQLWCNSRQGCLSGDRKCMRNSLKEFDFVFFVPLEKTDDANCTIEDIICDQVLEEDSYLRNDLKKVLSSDKYRCLILIDGVGEWNIEDSVKVKSKYDGIPNLHGLSNSTILFTSRPSGFQAVSHMVRDSDAVFRILGLDRNGAKSFADKLGKYLSLKMNAEKYEEILKLIGEKEVRKGVNFTVHPLLAAIAIQLMSQAETNDDMYPTYLVKFIDLLIEVAERKHGRFNKANGVIAKKFGLDLCVEGNYHFFKEIALLQKVGETALYRRESIDYQSETLASSLGLTESELSFALKVGLISKEETESGLTKKVKIRFLNSCIRHLLVAVYIVAMNEKSLVEELSMLDSEIELSSIVRLATGLRRSFAEEIKDSFRQIEDTASSNESLHSSDIETLRQNIFRILGSIKMEGKDTEDGVQNIDNTTIVCGNEVYEDKTNSAESSKQKCLIDLKLDSAKEISDDNQCPKTNGCKMEFDHFANPERSHRSSVGEDESTDIKINEIQKGVPGVNGGWIINTCSAGVSNDDDVEEVSASSSSSSGSRSSIDEDRDHNDDAVWCENTNVLNMKLYHNNINQTRRPNSFDGSGSFNLHEIKLHQTFQQSCTSLPESEILAIAAS